MRIIENMAMFLYILALGASNREVQGRFQYLGETINKYFKKVLKFVYMLTTDVVKSEDSEFQNTPLGIEIDPRYMPHFNVTLIYYCIINGINLFIFG